MFRYKLTLEYDGRHFHGFQRQDGFKSVQQCVEEAVFSFTQSHTRVHVAGRTDKGVHALAQVIHFDLNRDIDAFKMLMALNAFLRDTGCIILKVEQVNEDFHARFSAKARSYVYKILNRRAYPTIDLGRVWHVPKTLDVDLMNEAAKCLLGTHDFSTFRAAECQSSSPIKTLDILFFEKKGDFIECFVKSRSFLYHQVRNMVGTLKLVGEKKWTIDDFQKAFEKKSRKDGGPTAPADGLYFVSVDYDQNMVGTTGIEPVPPTMST